MGAESAVLISWKIGAVKITRVPEIELPGMKWIVPELNPENLNRIGWLKPHFVDARGEAMAAVQTFVIEVNDQRILVDTCIGNDKQTPIKFWNNRQGPFLQDLTGAGFAPESIDTVLCTHLHIDHVGWNTRLENGKWVPTFPRADYLFGRVEWEHWNTHRDGGQEMIMQQSVDPIVQAGRHRLVETNHRLCDEIWIEPTPGHTPGHVSVNIVSEGKRAIITGDLMHHPAQIQHPEWGCVADVDKEQAQATRRKFIEQHANGPTLVIGTHFAKPTAGRIVRDGDTHRFEVD
jgi:glyoxylase-like metal-dependent hydrolase (beta-lactamase superfamily II)